MVKFVIKFMIVNVYQVYFVNFFNIFLILLWGVNIEKKCYYILFVFFFKFYIVDKMDDK